MSGLPPRLNLIERAMQRAALPRETARVDDAAHKKTNGAPHNIFSEQKVANGAPLTSSLETPPAQIAGDAEPVRLDFAKLRASRIVTPDNAGSATYNEFRSLKRKLIPMTRDSESAAMTRNVVMVTSALPREGKTFTVMNLAICLAAERNLNVILVDGDVVRSSIAHYFNSEDRDGLIELLTDGRKRFVDVLHPCVDLPGLHVLFAGRHHKTAPELLASRRMAYICAELSKHSANSIVLFDTAPVLATSETAAMAAHAHHLIMLVASGRAARHQVEAALTEVSGSPSISLLFNQASQWQRPLSDPYYYYGDGAENFKEA